MAVVINNGTYYRTADVCRRLGISRNTLSRWLKEGMFSEVEYRDWWGCRRFTKAQVETVRTKNQSRCRDKPEELRR